MPNLRKIVLKTVVFGNFCFTNNIYLFALIEVLKRASEEWFVVCLLLYLVFMPISAIMSMLTIAFLSEKEVLEVPAPAKPKEKEYIHLHEYEVR